VAVIAGVIMAIVLAGRGGDGAPAPGSTPAIARRTSIPRSPTPDAGTPIPRAALHPVKLMFCEPLRELGIGGKIAVLPSDGQVAYKQGTCEPDLDVSGKVAVRNADGTTSRVVPAYVEVNTAPRETIIWTPAKGTLHGEPTVMTGAFLKQDALVVFDALGGPALIFNMNDDGKEVFGSLSERLIGYPLAMFIDGEPVRGTKGQIIAPTIQSRITDTGQWTGLTLDDAKRIAALIQYGYAQ